MKNIAYLTILFFLLVFVTNVSAAPFSVNVSPSTINAGTSNILLNFSVSNTGATNITRVNITLPLEFGYDSDAGTTVDTSKGLYSPPPNGPSWYNITSIGIVYGGTTQYFWFRVTTPSTGTFPRNFNFNVSTLDVNNIYNSTNVSVAVADQTAPGWFDNSTIPSSPTTYSPEKNYTFNITWRDNVNVSAVIFELGTTNYTNVASLGSNRYSITLTDLAVGNYTYRWYANDTANQWNRTDPLNYEVGKASILINVYFNGNLNQNFTIVNGTVLNVTATSSCTQANCSLYLYKNDGSVTNPYIDVLPIGSYRFKSNATGNANYSDNSTGVTYYVMIVPNYTVSTNIPSTYSPTTQTRFNITFSSSLGFSLLIEGNWYNITKKYNMTNVSSTIFSYSTILPAGTFYWQMYGNYSDHIFNLTPKNSFSIRRATPTLDLDASPSWSVSKDTQTNVSCSSDQVSVNLYRNNTSVSNPDVQTLAAGTYAYKCNNTETANYSSTSELNTLTVRVYLIDLTFTKAESLILVMQGSSNTTIVEVKNTGELSQNINFTIEDINSTWYSINATNASLASGKSASFRVNFSVGNVEIKDYTGKFKAYSSNKTITSNFTLRALPTKENEAVINSTLADYKEEMLELEKEINQTKAQGLNVSLAEEKLDQLKTKIEQGENYTAKGDYFNAYLILKEIETLIDDTKSELDKVKQVLGEEKTKSLMIYIIVGACVATGAILAYLFWPTKPNPTLKPEISKDMWFRLKKKWEKISKKRYRYKES